MPRPTPYTWIALAAFCLGSCGGGADESAAETEPAEETMPAPESGAQEGAQATSLLGQPLMIAPMSDSLHAVRDSQLAAARAEYEASPDDPDALIWYGRRTAYLGDYQRAIAIYTEGIERHPDDARMYRHRGHRFVSTRQLDRAIADFEAAVRLIEGTEDEVEPDGQPNARNIPTSTLHFNIWYHLGLARYLKGDFEGALAAYEPCLEASRNPDALVATSHWLYMTLRRLGREQEAARVLEPIHAELDVIENDSYHSLLLLYRGELEADELWDATSDDPAGAAVAYGVANWHLYNGRAELARDAFETIVQGQQWAGFGYIAAEAELSRLR